MDQQLFILYVGSLDEHSNSYRRFKTLSQLGHIVTGINTEQYVSGGIFTRFHYHLNIGPGINKLNKKVMEAIHRRVPDLLLVDNKPYITLSSLKQIKKKYPGIKIVNMITDDPTGRYKRTWRICLQTAYLYDVQFVQRAVNINELKNYGARHVELCYRSYDPEFHRPVVLTDKEKNKYQCAVGFIGTYESEREEFIAYLIQNGIPVQITGDGWPKGKYWSIISSHYTGPSVYGEEYVKRINGMDIALHFLRHLNRDQQDSRTFEIPACGVFMLAERSELHERFFKENAEAVLFDTKPELLEKVKYYLDNGIERKAIAAKGLQRCRESQYDHKAKLAEVIRSVFQ